VIDATDSVKKFREMAEIVKIILDGKAENGGHPFNWNVLLKSQTIQQTKSKLVAVFR
jgi:hypothetical protein